MSLVATDIGGTDIIGVGGAAYTYGMAVGNFEWIGCVPAMIVGAFVFIPFFWRIDVGGIGNLRRELQRIEQSAARHSAEPVSRDGALPGGAPAKPTGNNAEVVQYTELILPVDTATPFPWTGILFGLGLILSLAYWIGNQAIVQRSLGAKSEFEAKAAYVWGAVLKNLIPLIITVPGLIALVKFPDLADGDRAFPSLISVLLPVGLRGIFLAAFLAALMSIVVVSCVTRREPEEKLRYVVGGFQP